MVAWHEVESETPELAADTRRLLDANRHKTLATLRRDGGPRISGVEATFALGELWMGSMPGSRKAADLRRDPRFALHSASVIADDGDAASWSGDAKLSGRAVDVTDPAVKAAVAAEFPQPPPDDPDNPDGAMFDLFRLDVLEVVTIRVGDPTDHLVISTWHQGRGTDTTKRY